MTHDALAAGELQRLLDAATKGPWVAFDRGNTRAIMKGREPKRNANGYHVRRWPEIVAWTGFDASDAPKTQIGPNLHLIVAAVNFVRDALPSLLADLTAANARVTGLEAALREAEGHLDGSTEDLPDLDVMIDRALAAIQSGLTDREGRSE